MKRRGRLSWYPPGHESSSAVRLPVREDRPLLSLHGRLATIAECRVVRRIRSSGISTSTLKATTPRSSPRPCDRARRRPGDARRGRRRLAGHGHRVAFHEGSFLDPLPAADAVVASLALHHVHDLPTKTKLYRAIRDALSPAGVLLNLDAAVTEDKRLNGVLFDRWAARMGDHGITDAQARAHFASWSQEDRYFPLDAELHALRDAGFEEIECFWRRGPSAITCGRRAS